MPIYKKGKGSYRVVIFHRGERQDFTIRGTKADAEAFEARQRAQLEAGDALQGSRIAPRFFEFCASDYKPHARMQLRKSTWSVRVFHLATLCTHFGSIRLTEIDAAAVERFKLARHEAGRSPVTINNEIAVLQAVLTFARRVGVPAANPKYLFLRTTKSSRAKAWSTEEIARLYSQCSKLSPEVLPLVIFLANTGARPTEALRLEWSNVDLELGFIRIWPSEDWRPKDDEAREVPMSDELRAMLEAMPRTSSFVFATGDGERRKSFPKYPFERARDAAKITGGPYTLRHTFASHFLKVRPDMFLLARILGHSDVAVTRIYSHLMPDHLERARNAVRLVPIGFTPSAMPTRLAKTKTAPAGSAGSSRSRQTLPETLPGAAIASRACARTPKKQKPNQIPTRLDEWGIEPQTSRVRF